MLTATVKPPPETPFDHRIPSTTSTAIVGHGTGSDCQGVLGIGYGSSKRPAMTPTRLRTLPHEKRPAETQPENR